LQLTLLQNLVRLVSFPRFNVICPFPNLLFFSPVLKVKSSHLRGGILKFIVSSLTSDHRYALVFQTVCLIKFKIKLCINQLSLQEITSDIYNRKYSSFYMDMNQASVLPRALSKLEILPARTLRLSSTSTSKQSFISLYGQIMLKLVQRL